MAASPAGGELPVCCEPFATMYEFGEEKATGDRQHGCFVGIAQRGEAESTERAEGRWCGWGCAGQPGDMATCNDEFLWDMAALRDGHRFLAPNTMENVQARDARGMLHDLRSNTDHEVPALMSWVHGTGWHNERGPEEPAEECYGEDVCHYWRETHLGAWIDQFGQQHLECEPGIPVGSPTPLRGLLSDQMIRTGRQWPPEDMIRVGPGGTINNERFNCRSFGDARRGTERQSLRVNLQAPARGDPYGAVDPIFEPIIINATVCNSDLMVYLQGLVEPPPSGCPGEYYSIQSPTPGRYYNADNIGFRTRFSYIYWSPSGAGPQLAERPGIRGRSARIKNAVLPYLTQAPMDRLDSLVTTVGNAGIGQWARSSDSIFEVPNVVSRVVHAHDPARSAPARLLCLRRYGYVYLYLENTQLGLIFPSSAPRQLRPIVGCLMVATVAVVTTGENGVPINPYDSPEPWRYLDIEGQPFIPFRYVEWRGGLNAFTNPPAMPINYVGKLVDPTTLEHIGYRVANILEYPNLTLSGLAMRQEDCATDPSVDRAAYYQGRLRVGVVPR